MKGLIIGSGEETEVTGAGNILFEYLGLLFYYLLYYQAVFKVEVVKFPRIVGYIVYIYNDYIFFLK